MFKVGDKVICKKEFISITNIEINVKKGQTYTILESGFHYCNLCEIVYNVEYGTDRFESLIILRYKKLKQLENVQSRR